MARASFKRQKINIIKVTKPSSVDPLVCFLVGILAFSTPRSCGEFVSNYDKNTADIEKISLI
jgi:hypothetical protein